MGTAKREQFIKELKTTIALNKREVRRYRFAMRYTTNKISYKRKIQRCLKDIERLQSRLEIHKEVLGQL